MVRPHILVICLLFASGCAVLPLESSRIPHPSARVGPLVDSGYREAVGVIHIHSTYSDGSLPLEAIAKIANAQNLDFLIVTDHDTLQAKRDGKEGRYGNTLVLVGEEVSTEGGHYLALRVGKEIPRQRDPQWTIEAVSAQGGLGFIAHPFWPRRPWKDFGVRGFTGMEIYNAVQDVSEENPIWLGFWTVMVGSEFSLLNWLDRSEESLALWDQLLLQGNRVVGIGSPDAHGLQRFGLRLGPYGTMFRLVRTHLLLKDLSAQALYDALSRGHAFVGHDLVADTRGFIFAALRGKSVCGVMGDSVKYGPGLQLYAYLPSPGEIVLFKDGKETSRAQGQHAVFPLTSPVIYRVEATRKGKP